MNEKNLPSPGSLRAMREKLRAGVSEEEQETIEELLASAKARVLAEIPASALPVLSSLSPTLLEAYALLQQPVEVKVREQQQDQESIKSEATAPGMSPLPAQRTSQPAVSGKSKSLTLDDDGDGMSVTLTAGNATEQAFLDALSGLNAQAGGHVAHGQSLRVVPPVTPTMTLDPFQNAYHGQVEVKTGSKKHPRTEYQVIGVIREVYEAERDRVGAAAVKDPAYWLDKVNWMSVYLVEELERTMEVAWILGDYDPVSSGVPAGIKATPEQIAAYLSAGVDDEDWDIQVIKMHLRTEEQRAWMAAQDYSIEDLLNGRTHGEPEIEEIYADWNKKLGVKQFGY